jgi:hypothetical protein
MDKPSTRPEQLEVPGAAPLTGPQTAQRRALQPLRLKAAQEPCDVGLFSDEAQQIDLIDLLWRS